MEAYKKLLAYAPEKRGNLILAILSSGLSAIALVVGYFFIWRFLQALLSYEDMDLALNYGTKVIILLVTYVLLYFIGVWSSHLLGFRVETNMRKKSAKKVVDGSFHFFDNTSSGETRKIINENAANTHSVIAHMIPDLTSAVVAPILMVIMASTIDIFFGILIIISLVFSIICLQGMMSDMSFMEKYLEATEKMNAETVEYVRGMQVIKIFGASVYTFKNFYQTIKDQANLAYQHAIECKRPYVLFQVVLNLMITFTIPYGLWTLSRSSTALEVVAKVIFFAIFAGIVYSSMTKIMYVGSDMFMAQEAVDKMEGIFDDMEEKKLDFGTCESMESTDIEFKNVTFSYGEDAVLEDLSFTLEGGRSYALVGSSGSGKSTMAKLIGGFYELDSGEILIGGLPIDDYSEEYFNQKLAMVFQDAKLFDMSVFDNVKLARPDASDEEVLQALEDASCQDIIEKLPDGVHTMLGSEGVSLSGGEVQRIAIARAILKDADIVILDEASAAADADNEYQIQLAFSRLMEEKTVIMIAHRLSSIRNVDEILVIDHGEIVERGSHDQLMEDDGLYKSLQDMYAQANEWRVSNG